MPDENKPNGSPQSLREIAESAYNELETNYANELQDEAAGAEESSSEENPVAQDGQPRDKSGRWVAKEPSQPGEAIEPLDPAPKAKPKVSETQEAAAPDPAVVPPPTRSNQAPEHWSAEDKAAFAKLPQEGQSFLLKRHGEMEAEFTRKSQVSAGAVQFTQALAPVFNDPQIAGVLRQTGQNPVQAITEWANFYRLGTSQNQQDKFTLLVNLTQRMGLDPARIFTALNNQPPPLPPGFAEADLKDPAIKFFADHLGRVTNDYNALKGEVQQMRQASQAEREEQGVKFARSGIDGFAEEKGRDGNLLHPHFDTVLPVLIEMFRANPSRDLREAYDTACWAHPEVRKQLIAAERQSVQAQHDVERARIAARGNTRGVSAPAVRPNGAADGPSRGTLRDAIERSADEIGFTS